MAEFARIEKRLKRKIDVNSHLIIDRIKFAVDELNKVDYFDLKNASIKSFKTKDFLTSKPLAIINLKHICESKLYDYETSLNYQKYCDEILGFLERNAKMNKVKLASRVEKNIEFSEYNNVDVDSYDKLWDAISMVVGARVNNEQYEIVVEDNKENGNKIIKISLISNIIKTDKFTFEFTDPKKLDEELIKIQDNLAKLDPSFELVVKRFGDKEVVLNKTISGNEWLDIKKIVNNQQKNDQPKKYDIIERIKKIKKEKPNTSPDSNEVNTLNKEVDKVSEINKEISIEDIEKANTLPDNNEVNTLNNEVDKVSGINKEISIEDLEKIEKYFSDYMLEKEKNEKVNEFVNDIPFINLSISTYELLTNKYKDDLFELYQNKQLPEDEVNVINNIKSFKDKLENYYNKSVNKNSTFTDEEIKNIANCEVALAEIYRLDSKYDNNMVFSNMPSDLLKSKVYQNEFERNEKYIDELVDLYINKYRAILQKYTSNEKYDENELTRDKDILLQIISYKTKLKDTYDNIINRNNLSNNDLSTLAKYERILYDIYEIDSKYQENIEKEINELKGQEQFLTPSSKIYLSVLEKELNNRKNINVVNEKKENEYLFQIINQDEIQKENNEIEDIKNAYYKTFEQSNSETPLDISIVFDKNNKNNAELIISIFNGKESNISYRKTFDSEKIKEMLPILCGLFDENELENFMNSNEKYTGLITKKKPEFSFNKIFEEYFKLKENYKLINKYL